MAVDVPRHSHPARLPHRATVTQAVALITEDLDVEAMAGPAAVAALGVEAAAAEEGTRRSVQLLFGRNYLILLHGRECAIWGWRRKLGVHLDVGKSELEIVFGVKLPAHRNTELIR